MIRTRRTQGVLACLLGALLAASAAAQPSSPRIASYEMDVRLDPVRKMLRGTAVLAWRNATVHPAGELRFHLYYNAWRNDRSSFFRRWEALGFPRRERGEEHLAYSVVESMRLLEAEGRAAEDLTPRMEYIQPDDGNEEDRTVLRVPLDAPVAPGETVRVEIVWECRIPRALVRTGYAGDYYFLGQWFPKIGVFEEGGTWNCHQFISTEFFADFGNYDVRITVPTGWVVGATGRESGFEVHPDGTTMRRFVQEDVHDFAWTACPRFREFRERFEADGLPPVEMRLLLMPEHLAHKDRYFAATRATLTHYGGWFGPYPYGHLTIVDPAYRSRSGGMEYPTLFTGGAEWLSPRETLSPEGVTVHECGHQFWYGLVANNEFEHGWMDEGFNTYSTSRTLRAAFPPRRLTSTYLDGFLPLVFREIPTAYRTDGADGARGFESIFKTERMSTPTFEQGRHVRVHTYEKPALMLRTLENWLGEETFLEVMSTYFERFEFQHPTPGDFFQVASEVSGQDLGWFFEETWNSSNVFDYAVDSVTSTPVRPPRGFVEAEGGVAMRNDRETEEERKPALFDSEVTVRRWGEAIFPVEVRITFSDGESVVENWDGRERSLRFSYRRPARVDAVEVDPRRVLVLDVNSTNNSWVRRPMASLASKKWASKWMIWLQNLLEQLAFFS